MSSNKFESDKFNSTIINLNKNLTTKQPDEKNELSSSQSLNSNSRKIKSYREDISTPSTSLVKKHNRLRSNTLFAYRVFNLLNTLGR